MNKKILIRTYRSELKELENQESLMKQTINAITRRKMLLKMALDELGASGAAPRGVKPNHLSSKDVYSIKVNMTKKRKNNLNDGHK